MSSPAIPQQSVLDKILAVLQIGLNAASVAGGSIGNDAQIAALLLKLAQSAVGAYEAQVGQPIDPNLLKPEALIQ